MNSRYVPLWCKSNGSFLEGASHPEELVDQACELGLPALALTDRNGVYGLVRAHVRAQERGLRLIAGSELTLTCGATVVLLCQDRTGYANLCRLVTTGHRRNLKGSCSVTWTEVADRAVGLVALVRTRPPEAVREAFGDRIFALLTRRLCPEDREREVEMGSWPLPSVAATEVLYHHPGRSRLQDVLTCIRHRVPLAEAGSRLRSNAEDYLRSHESFHELFRDRPDAVARSLEVAERCRFSLSELRYRYPTEHLPDGTTSAQRLRRLTLEGARRRYAGEVPADVLAQLERELALIEELDYCGYFLTMRDIVEFCQARNILCQGRGSAASSAVCYCLHVTAVDPVKMGLLFERFISRDRAEPPDIDLDIAHERREEVIQHVYERHGREHAAMVANVVRYRPRSAIRDVGKALGLDLATLERMTKLVSYHDATVDPALLKRADLDPTSPTVQHLLGLTREILDFPRHLSIHPGGFLLGHEPVCELVPIENATMADRTVIQWDKYDVEALSLFKVDLLGLGALTHLDRCFRLIAHHTGVELSMATLPPDDESTFDMLCRANSVGVFQVESRAQMAMLPRLRPRCYYDLVIEVSIVRPGPITGGMVHPYLRRRNGEEPIDYPHPSLKPVLEKTLGVPLFQEQVMRLAVVAADYTPGEADQLRRDMAAWQKVSRIEQHRDRLITRMRAKGISLEFAERVFEQIRGFGEYGFPESHAASFALVSYATAYLKCHHPAEFTCSLLNGQPMGFYSPATIVEDAERNGVRFAPIDVHHSDWDCLLEADSTVRMGLRYVKGLSEAAAAAIGPARPFRSVRDLASRTALDARSMSCLAEAGALESLGVTRRQGLWEAGGARVSHELVDGDEVVPAFAELTHDDHILWDLRASHHSTRGHPLESARAWLTEQGLPDAASIASLPDEGRVSYAGLVICRQRPETAKGITFMTLEDETGFVNLVLKSHILDRYPVLARTASFLGVDGTLESRHGVVHIVADRLWAPRPQRQLPSISSRDFH